MNHALIALLFTIIMSPFCSSVHGARRVSTRELMRLAEQARQAPAPTPAPSSPAPQAAPTEVEEIEEPVVADLSSIPLPKHPGTKEESWTADQKKVWDRIETQRLIVHNVIDQSEDAETAPGAKRVYLDGVKKLEDVFDENLVGTDPKEVIASLPALQQLLLHSILYIPTGNAHPYHTNPEIKEAIIELYKELFSQWEELGLENGAMALQIQNVDAAYAVWTDQPLSSTEVKALEGFQSALAVLDTATDDRTYSPEDKAQAGKRLKESFKTLANGGAFARSSLARKQVIMLPDDIGEGLSSQAQEDVMDTLNMIEDHLDRIMFTKKQQAKIASIVDDAQADASNTEKAHREAAKITAFLAREWYQNAEQLYPVESFSRIKKLREDFFGRAHIAMKPCAEAMRRFRELVMSNDDVMQAVKDDDFPVIEVMHLPETFFTRAQQQPAKLRYPFAEAGTNLAMFLTRKLGPVGRPELRDIIAGFDSIALATKEEQGVFDSLSSDWMYFIQVAGRIDTTFHESLADELQPIAQQEPVLPPRSGLPTHEDAAEQDQQQYRYLLNHIMRIIKNNTVLMTSNYRMRKLLINPTTNRAFLTRIPRNLTPENRKLSQTFMTIQRQGIQAVSSKLQTRVSTDYDWTSNEEVVRSRLRPIHKLVYVNKEGEEPVIVSEKLFKRSSRTDKLTEHLKDIGQMLASPAEAEKQKTLRESAVLRDSFVRLFTFPDAFFEMASEQLSDVARYELASAGASLCFLAKASIQLTGLTEEQFAHFDTLHAKFNNLALHTDEEKKLHTTLKDVMVALVNAGTNIAKFDQEKGRLLTEEVDRERDALIRDFTAQALQLKSLLENRTRRIMLGTNHMMRIFLFTMPENNFFLKDIPEGLTPRARDAITSILETVKSNPRNFKYHNTPQQDSITFHLSELIRDAKTDERDALSKMSPAAKDIHRQLMKSLSDLKRKETYHVGAHALFRLLSEEENRELIGDNEPLYGMLFSPKGLLQMPEGINPMRPFDPGGFDIDSGLAGYKLYDIILANPSEMGIKKRDDSLAEAWLKRTHQTFSVVTKSDFGKLVKQVNPNITDSKGNVVTAQQAQTAALSSTAGNLGTQEGGAETPEEIEKEQELLMYLQDKNAALQDPDLFIDGAQELLDRLKDNDLREEFKRFPAVVKLLISPQGLILGLSTLPKELSIEALKIGIALFQEIKKHPNDLGYRSKKSTVHPRLNGLVKALTRRLKKLEQAKRDKEVATGHDDDVNKYGGAVSVEKALGPKPDMSDMNDRQRQVLNLLYKIYDDLRSRSIIVFEKAISEMLATTTKLNENEAFFGLSIRQKWQLFHLIAHPELSKRFRETVLVDFIPDDSYEKKPDGTDKYAKQRKNIRAFYSKMIDQETDFDLDALNMQKARNIIDWFTNEESAPKRSHYIKDALFDEADEGNAYTRMLAMQASLSGNSSTQMANQLGMSSAGMNPYMMQRMGGMYGMGGMGMNTMNPMGQMGGMRMNSMNPMARMNPMGGMNSMGMMNPMMNPMGGYHQKAYKSGGSHYDPFVAQMQMERLIEKNERNKQRDDELAKLKQQMADLKSGKTGASRRQRKKQEGEIRARMANLEAQEEADEVDDEENEEELNIYETDPVLQEISAQIKRTKQGHDKLKEMHDKLLTKKRLRDTNKRRKLSKNMAKLQAQIADLNKQYQDRVSAIAMGEVTPEGVDDEAEEELLDTQKEHDNAPAPATPQPANETPESIRLRERRTNLEQQLDSSVSPMEAFKIRYQIDDIDVDLWLHDQKEGTLASLKREEDNNEKAYREVKKNTTWGWNRQKRNRAEKRWKDKRKARRKLERKINATYDKKKDDLREEYDTIYKLSAEKLAALDRIMRINTLEELDAHEKEIKTGRSTLKRLVWQERDRAFALKHINKRRNQLKQKQRLGTYQHSQRATPDSVSTTTPDGASRTQAVPDTQTPLTSNDKLREDARKQAELDYKAGIGQQKYADQSSIWQQAYKQEWQKNRRHWYGTRSGSWHTQHAQKNLFAGARAGGERTPGMIQRLKGHSAEKSDAQAAAQEDAAAAARTKGASAVSTPYGPNADQAVRHLQRVARGHAGRRQAAVLRKERQDHPESWGPRNEDAYRLPDQQTGSLEVDDISMTEHRYGDQENEAALTIQRNYRGHLGRKRAARIRKKHDKMREVELQRNEASRTGHDTIILPNSTYEEYDRQQRESSGMGEEDVHSHQMRHDHRQVATRPASPVQQSRRQSVDSLTVGTGIATAQTPGSHHTHYQADRGQHAYPTKTVSPLLTEPRLKRRVIEVFDDEPPYNQRQKLPSYEPIDIHSAKYRRASSASEFSDASTAFEGDYDDRARYEPMRTPLAVM